MRHTMLAVTCHSEILKIPPWTIHNKAMHGFRLHTYLGAYKAQSLKGTTAMPAEEKDKIG